MLSAALEHAITLGLLPTGTTIAALETPITRGELAIWMKTFVVAIPIISNKGGRNPRRQSQSGRRRRPRYPHVCRCFARSSSIWPH